MLCLVLAEGLAGIEALFEPVAQQGLLAVAIADLLDVRHGNKINNQDRNIFLNDIDQ